MLRWIRIGYAAWVGVTAVLYFALPEPPRYLWTLIGCSSVLAMLSGILVHRPRERDPWLLLAAGVAFLVLGDTTYDLLVTAGGQKDPFPSVADVVYLTMYLLIAVGVFMLLRARATLSDRQASLDAVIVTAGLALLMWVFLIDPYVLNQHLSVVHKAFSIAYPTGDLLILAMIVRLLMGGGPRTASLRLLAAGALALMTADVLYGLAQLDGRWHTGGPVDVGWIIFYAAWGAAALHPDMARIAHPVAPQPHLTSRTRLSVLALVSLGAPGLLLVQSVRGTFHEVGAIALTSAVVFVLVVLRLHGLLEIARTSARREQVLRRTSDHLVAASTADQIAAVGGRAISEIAATSVGDRVWVALERHDSVEAVFDSVGEGPADFWESWNDLLQGQRVQLEERRFLLARAADWAPLAGRGDPDLPVLIAGLVSDGTVLGVLVIAGEEACRWDIVDAACALASQMVLALESVRLTEQALQRRNERYFRSLIQNASDIILVLDAELSVVYVTPSARSTLGRRVDGLVGRPVEVLFSDEDAPHALVLLRRLVDSGSRVDPSDPDDEWRLADEHGEVLTFEVTCSNLLPDPAVNGLVLTLHDITDRRRLEDELKHLAFHDSLTTLPNRALFLDRVQHALARRNRRRLAVMLIDLDDFKIVNDTRGHATGDELLVQVGARLRAALRPEDTCARLGGDEFAVLVESLVHDDEARQLADRLLRSLREPYHLEYDDIVVGASIGLSTSDDGLDAPELLRQADLAMYAAKDSGKGTHQFFRRAFQEEMHARLSRSRDLERALARGEFQLHYQPILDLTTETVLGVEALLRWQHPERGLLLPGSFIDAVEESDLAVPLGGWVLEESIAQAASWQGLAARDLPLRMSVNVAPRQLREAGFVDDVVSALERHGLPASALMLEITERMFAGDEPHIVTAMDRLRSLGVRLALDDFGTGYSALAYLRRFPVTSLKIDRSFVSGLTHSQDDRALVEAIIRLGETFGLELVAEGIEECSQRDALTLLGCRQGQGFLYSRPLPAAEARAYIAEHAAQPFPAGQA
ncbi:MAG: hypothetical protein QOF53_1820 [Nocardioidaceae bacterium]|nr:hypothetical protein [Nocardioidaceae bacterium]